MTARDAFSTYGRRFNPAALVLAMESIGYSCSGVAFEMGKRPYDVRNWTEGKARPSLGNLVRLCEILKCRIDDLAPKHLAG